MDHMPHLRHELDLLESLSRPEKIETVSLAYDKEDLAPVMSKQTLDYHYEKLAKGYTKRYNDRVGDPEFNRAGSYLHNRFFSQFRAARSANKPTGPVLLFIEKHFGDFENFQSEWEQAAMKIQGSGWVYLTTKGKIATIVNHAIRSDIVLILDMWEHAFALDYQHDKQKYINNFWKIVDWSVINDRIPPK